MPNRTAKPNAALAGRFLCDNSVMTPTLTDGVIFLRPLDLSDAADHLAGEDDEIANWLSGGRSTMASVERYITSCQEHWRTDGPIRAFGVFDCSSNRLIGSIEANLAYRSVPGQLNISYGVFPGWRGKGIARRALDLMSSYLRSATGLRQMVVRIACANAASVRVVEKAGFQFLGVFDEPQGRMARYARDL
jgi:RimJ/RimL family protein N-acetyltransferase